MRASHFIACLSLATLLSACDNSDQGYYDANGNWIAYNKYAHQEHAPLPGGAPNSSNDNDVEYTTVTTYHYDRPGYYNDTGYYTAMSGGVRAPEDMLPPRGMCRVWFPHRALADQPEVESCDGIRSRVPAGAYVIYGG